MWTAGRRPRWPSPTRGHAETGTATRVDGYHSRKALRWWRTFVCHSTGLWQAKVCNHRFWYALPLGVTVLLLLFLAACADAPVHTPTPARASPPSDVQAVSGHARYVAVGCAACHGEKAEGGIGPRISGITTPLPDVEAMMRTDKPHGVKYDDEELTNQDIVNIYLWLRTNPAGDLKD